MTREYMMNRVINKYGFESKKTIRFCRLCESKTATDAIILGYFRLLITA